MQHKTSEILEEKRLEFFINDHIDILVEVLKRLDGASLSVAACVCRIWCTVARDDSLWEHVCFRHTSTPPHSLVRTTVVALGGYKLKRLYMGCVRQILGRLGGSDMVRRGWTQNQVQLSLSLFCVDYYERIGDASAFSLVFLCKQMNV